MKQKVIYFRALAWQLIKTADTKTVQTFEIQRK